MTALISGTEKRGSSDHKMELTVEGCGQEYGIGSQLSGFEPQLYHLLAVELRKSYLTSQDFVLLHVYNSEDSPCCESQKRP